MRRRFSCFSSSILALVILTLATNPVRAQTKAQFDLPAQPLAEAIRAVASQSGINILVDPSLVAGRRAPALKAHASFQEALSRILAGSGLEARFVDERTVTLVSASKQQADADKGKSEAPQSRATQPTAEISGTNSYAHLAQTEPVSQPSASQRPRDQDAPALRDGTVELGEIVVTGTHIRGVAPDSSPLTIYSRRDIEQSGVATVEQFLQKIPQNLSSIDPGTPGLQQRNSGMNQLGGNQYQGAGVNLHGLGPGATLTLVNGHRLSPAGNSADFVDVSLIPLSAIERIEILTDGASALYGSDAIAGVVNFVLREEFQGAETALRYGGATQGGANEFAGTQLLGRSWSSGNVMLVYEYYAQDSLLSMERDFIPDQGGLVTVRPEVKRNSALLSGRQEIAGGIDLRGEASYSQRDSQSDTFFGVPSHGVSQAEQYGANVNLARQMAGSWRGTAGVNYFKTEQFDARTRPSGNSIIKIESTTNTELGELTLRTDGSLFRMAAGEAKGAIGTGYRSEKIVSLTSNNEELKRNVSSLYGEVLIPLVGEQNASPWAQRLELSIAGRYDDYSDVGSSANPKVGVLWSVADGLNVRGTYGTSFKAPLLVQLLPNPVFFTFDIEDPSSPSGFTDTLIDLSSGNAVLNPEEAETIALGFDYKPPRVPGLSISATYFSVNFNDRIGAPPIVGDSFLLIYSQEETLAPFIDRSPDLATVQSIFNSPGFFGDFAGRGAEGVEAIFDQRLFNLSSTKQSGIDFTVNFDRATQDGEFGISLSGTYLFEIDFQAVSTTPVVSVLDTIGQPTRLHLRGGLNWGIGALSSSLAVNYRNGYENSFFSPSRDVDSWTTADLYLSYSMGGDRHWSLFRDMVASLSIQNMTDEDPPQVLVPPTVLAGGGIGYDPSNASPLGRFISFQIRKRW